MWRSDHILAVWYPSRNWGDALSPFLIEAISGRKAYLYSEVFHSSSTPVYSVIGSILGAPLATGAAHLIVWGSGFIARDRSLSRPPTQVCAVRGPLTRQRLEELGVSCPPVYGDPALLLPRYLQPRSKEKKYRLGIIPHFIDQHDPVLEKFRGRDDVLIIDICGGIQQVVDQVCSCEVVASSSLHGLICADAYGVPNVWLKLSDKVVGGEFKFHDYFLSIGRSRENPLWLRNDVSIEQIIDNQSSHDIEIDLELLLDSCPFRVNQQGSTAPTRTD